MVCQNRKFTKLGATGFHPHLGSSEASPQTLAKGRPKSNLGTVPIFPQGKWDCPPPKPGNSTEGCDDPTELIAEKARWVQTPQTYQNARLRCRTIRRINRDLQPWVEARRGQLLQQQTRLDRALRAEQVLASREYGFCLYPEKTFRGFLRGILPKDA